MDSLTFYGRVPPDLIKKALLWGSFKGFFGLILLPFGGIFFIAGLLLIAWGLIPYRQLKKLEQAPPTLTLTDQGLSYKVGEKTSFFSTSDIQAIDYKDGSIIIQGAVLPLFSEKTFQQLKSIINSDSTEEL